MYVGPDARREARFLSYLLFPSFLPFSFRFLVAVSPVLRDGIGVLGLGEREDWLIYLESYIELKVEESREGNLKNRRAKREGGTGYGGNGEVGL